MIFLTRISLFWDMFSCQGPANRGVCYIQVEGGSGW